MTNTNDAGAGSLRWAINEANTNTDPDVIVFELAIPTPPPAVITLGSGQLAITDAVTITRPGADQLTIDGDQQSRIFSIDGGEGDPIDVVLCGLTLTGGALRSACANSNKHLCPRG